MLLSLLPRGFLPPERFIAWEHVAHLLSGSCGMVTPSTRKPLPRSMLAVDHIVLGVPNSVDRLESRYADLGPSLVDSFRYTTMPDSWLDLRVSIPGWSAEHTCSPLMVEF